MQIHTEVTVRFSQRRAFFLRAHESGYHATMSVLESITNDGFSRGKAVAATTTTSRKTWTYYNNYIEDDLKRVALWPVLSLDIVEAISPFQIPTSG